MTAPKKFSHTTEAVFVILILVATLALLYYTKATGIRFKPFSQSDVLAIITSVFVVAVFMERAIEAILTPIRAPDRQKIEQELEAVKEAKGADTVRPRSS